MSRIKKADPAFSIGQCFEFRNVLPYSLFLSNFQRGKSVREGEKMIVATFPRISKTRCAMEKKEEGREGRGLEFNGLSSGEGEGPR